MEIHYSRFCLLASLSALFFWLSLFYFRLVLLAPAPLLSLNPLHLSSNSSPIPPPIHDSTTEITNSTNISNFPSKNQTDSCRGRYIYVHNLHPMFNDDMVNDCQSICLWNNLCKYTTNAGLGPPLEEPAWYATNQFMVEIIFRNRMKQYECLTNDSSKAAAVFVPFFAGLDIFKHLLGHNISTRDAASLALVDWLTKRPEWGVMGGKDHFIVAGRVAWDMRRKTDEDSDWGSKFLFLPAIKNMSTLIIEASPWDANEYAIPYPTYFHPARDIQVWSWQDRVRKVARQHLFCFAGAPRPGNHESIRGLIIDQCGRSKVCKLLECGSGESKSKCHSPGRIMEMFRSSHFCLQPQGDSYSRRSAFDSMLAGCVPVFFHPGSAYVQYTWHLPGNYSTYSVFIPEDEIRKNASIEQRLRQISPEKVKEMREVVINLIPQLVYADPRSKLETVKDAFDVAVKAVIDKVTRLRKNKIEGRKDDDFIWKYGGTYEWDSYFPIRRKDDKSVHRQDNKEK